MCRIHGDVVNLRIVGVGDRALQSVAQPGPRRAAVAGLENAVTFAADIDNVGIGWIDGERMEHRVLIITDIALQEPIDGRGAIVALGKRPERQQRQQYENSKTAHGAEIPKFDRAT